MNIWRALIVALPALLAAGCRSDPSRDLLERDNFNKEQEIYQLKCRIDDLQAQLDAAAASAPPAMTRPARPGETLSEPGRLEAAPAFTQPGPAASPQPAAEGPSLPGGGPLRITPGVEIPSAEGPGLLRTPSGNGSGRNPQGNMYYWQPTNVRLAGGTAPADDSRAVMQITLHPALTGGIGNGAAGDQGLLVVVEPRDQAGNIVVAPGQTSVALIDPALQGEQARFARWDFSPAQTARMLHTGSEPGIHLRLPWRAMPAHDRMKVYVRVHDPRWPHAPGRADHRGGAWRRWRGRCRTCGSSRPRRRRAVVRRSPAPSAGPAQAARPARGGSAMVAGSGLIRRFLAFGRQARPVGIMRAAAERLQPFFLSGR